MKPRTRARRRRWGVCCRVSPENLILRIPLFSSHYSSISSPWYDSPLQGDNEEKMLKEFCRDLCAEVRAGRIDPVSSIH